MTDSTFWKKISPAVDINDLAGTAEPKLARISQAEVKAVQLELAEWLEDQPFEVRAVGLRIIGHLNAARIGARSHPAIVTHLAEDVAKLEHAALLSRK